MSGRTAPSGHGEFASDDDDIGSLAAVATSSAFGGVGGSFAGAVSPSGPTVPLVIMEDKPRKSSKKSRRHKTSGKEEVSDTPSPPPAVTFRDDAGAGAGAGAYTDTEPEDEEPEVHHRRERRSSSSSSRHGRHGRRRRHRQRTPETSEAEEYFDDDDDDDDGGYADDDGVDDGEEEEGTAEEKEMLALGLNPALLTEFATPAQQRIAKSALLQRMADLRVLGYTPAREYSMVDDVEEIASACANGRRTLGRRDGLTIVREFTLLGVKGLENGAMTIAPGYLSIAGTSEACNNSDMFGRALSRVYDLYFSAAGEMNPIAALILSIVLAAGAMHVTNRKLEEAAGASAVGTAAAAESAAFKADNVASIGADLIRNQRQGDDAPAPPHRPTPPPIPAFNAHPAIAAARPKATGGGNPEDDAMRSLNRAMAQGGAMPVPTTPSRTRG